MSEQLVRGVDHLTSKGADTQPIKAECILGEHRSKETPLAPAHVHNGKCLLAQS